MARVETNWLYQRPPVTKEQEEERFIVITTIRGRIPGDDTLTAIGPFKSFDEAERYGMTLEKVYWVKTVIPPIYERLSDRATG